MSRQKLLLLLAGLSAVIIFAVCDDSGTEPSDNIRLQLVNTSDCKQFTPVSSVTDKKSESVPPNLDCLEYSYINNRLTVIHRNAGFNCCANIKASLQISGDTIRIIESELGPFCKCLCLFDVYYELANLPRGEYIIMIDGLYMAEDDSTLNGVMNLNDYPNGTICFIRDYYPWNIGYVGTGMLKEYSECGGFDRVAIDDLIPDDSICIVYNYLDSTGVLSIIHQNATFNCCVEALAADIWAVDHAIYIDESEVLMNGGCDCLCPYDLNMELTGISPGVYTIYLSGEYLPETIEIELDLINNPVGYHCYAPALQEL